VSYQKWTTEPRHNFGKSGCASDLSRHPAIKRADIASHREIRRDQNGPAAAVRARFVARADGMRSETISPLADRMVR
jgi:hypothetical protein